MLCCQNTTVSAEDVSSWKGEGELGFTNTSGNTETQTLIAKLSLGYTSGLWEHTAKFDALRNEEGGTTSAERYGATAQTNYSLTEMNYLFGKGKYDNDSFSGYDYQASLSTGYGRHLIKTDDTGLKVEVGLGMRQSKMDTEESDTTDEVIGTAGLGFRQKVGSHSELTEGISIEAGNDDVVSTSDTGFKMQVMDQVSVKLSVALKHNSDVPTGRDKLDTTTAVTVVYGF